VQRSADTSIEFCVAELAVEERPRAEPQAALLHAAASPVADLPVIVGVTGHRNLVAALSADLEARLEQVLADLHRQFPSLQVACAFAEGADQLVGRIANKLKIPLLAVLPMPRGAYRDSLPAPARAGLDDLIGRAELTLELPWVTETHDHIDQYEQLGLLLARRSHILLALWDGNEAEQGRGGTAHVVRMRKSGSQEGGVFVRSALFPESRSRLDLAGGGPILHVHVQRDAGRGVADAASPGLRLWQGHDTADPNDDWQSIARLDKDHLRDGALGRIIDLNRDLAAIRQTSGLRTAEHLGHLGAHQFPDPPLGGALRFLHALRDLQTDIDLAAQDKRRPLVLAHWLFTLAVPSSVLCFELYSNVWADWELLVACLIIPLVAFGYDKFSVKSRSLQTKFQDYRALAEALRVQLFWSLSAVPQAVSDSYLRKQQDDLGWIRDALHGPALWATAIALAMPRPDRHQVEAVWLRGQKSFFVGDDGQGGRARANERTYQRCRWWLRFFAGTSLVLCAFLLLVQIPWLGFLRPGPVSIKFLIASVGFSPAVAAAFGIYAERLALEQHAHSYAAMGALFGRALREANHIDYRPACDDAFRDLVKELGREALDENAEWLKEHRGRPITFSTV
jgi:hypothetical protein